MKTVVAPCRQSRFGLLWHAIALAALVVLSPLAEAGSREQAKRIFDRIAGVPADEATIDQLQALIDADAGGRAGRVAAAMEAMEHPAFYNVTLKNFVTPWTNRDANVFAPLNDYTATVIGMVRDGVDFRTALYDDIIYVANGTSAPGYSTSNNAHYEYLEQNHLNLKDVLVRRQQSAVTGLRAEATAGLMTTRAAAKSFFIAGTNRAMFRFTLMNHLCNDLEQVKDITRVPDRIRQDVTRSPGGDSRLFNNTCIGCHNGMDPLAQAFAYYDFEYDSAADPEGNNGQLVYNDVGMTDPFTGTRVKKKYLINENNFKPGYVTPDDRWDNYWRAGPNKLLGWDESRPSGGNGAKTMGQELAHSEAFAQCQVKKVFKAVCLRNPVDSADRSEMAAITDSFKASGYQMKQIFAETAAYCAGE
ncbi:MAG: hypothetical protein ACK4E7_01455 [Permianibacter sp.]